MKTRTLQEIERDIAAINLHIAEEQEKLERLEWEWNITYERHFETKIENDIEMQSYYAKREGK